VLGRARITERPISFSELTGFGQSVSNEAGGNAAGTAGA